MRSISPGPHEPMHIAAAIAADCLLMPLSGRCNEVAVSNEVAEYAAAAIAAACVLLPRLLKKRIIMVLAMNTQCST